MIGRNNESSEVIMTGKKRSFLIIVLCLAIHQIFWLGACDSKKEPIKIGLAVNLSGTGGTAGEYIREGAMIAAEEINKEGGIHGRPISLIIKDDENTDQGIIRADKELIAQGVPVIIGHTYSESTLKAYPYVTSQNTLLITPYTATSRLTGKDDLFFRTSVDTVSYGRALSALLAKRQLKRVCFLMDMSNPSFTLEYVEQTGKHFSGNTYSVEFNSRKETDWGIVIRELMEPNPEAIVLLTEVTMTGVSAQKLRSRGFEGDLIATTWAQTSDLMRYGGEAVEGMTIITFIKPRYDTAKYKSFAGKIKENFHHPVTARSVRAYEAVYMISEALKRCSAFTSMEIKRNLLRLPEVDYIMGPVRFDAFGDVIRPIYEVRIKDAKFYNAGQIK
jgi:branched-chain amino acid transport system substrate-binding protein